MDKNDNSQEKVLSDHKKVGKAFLPPIRQLENLKLIRWADDILPEIVWIALIQNHHSIKEANDKALLLAKVCEETLKGQNARNPYCFAFISSYGHLTIDQKKEVKQKLGPAGLDDLVKSLESLITLYPECPISFLYDGDQNKIVGAKKDDMVETLKSVVGSISDRHGRPAMLAQATAIYIELVTEHLKVFRGSGLENLEDIKEYPKTEASKKVASFIRASLNTPTLMSESKNRWCEYFWNRGFEISGCLI